MTCIFICDICVNKKYTAGVRPRKAGRRGLEREVEAQPCHRDGGDFGSQVQQALKAAKKPLPFIFSLLHYIYVMCINITSPPYHLYYLSTCMYTISISPLGLTAARGTAEAPEDVAGHHRLAFVEVQEAQLLVGVVEGAEAARGLARGAQPRLHAHGPPRSKSYGRSIRRVLPMNRFTIWNIVY